MYTTIAIELFNDSQLENFKKNEHSCREIYRVEAVGLKKSNYT